MEAEEEFHSEERGTTGTAQIMHIYRRQPVVHEVEEDNMVSAYQKDNNPLVICVCEITGDIV